MRRLLLLLFLSVLAAAQPAKISGRVVSQSGDAMRGAALMLIGTETLTGISGENGAFEIEKIPPGAFALVARMEGFAPQKYGASTVLSDACDMIADTPTQSQRLCISGAPGVTLSVTAGQELKDLTINLTPLGSIHGHVSNQDGEPVAHWQVEALKLVYEHGVRRLQGSEFGPATDADGNFSLTGLAPGRYYLFCVDNRSRRNAGLLPGRQGKAPAEVDVPTYFPNQTEASRAVALDVQAGTDLRDRNIVLRRERVYSIRGKVTVPAQSEANNQILSIVEKGGSSEYQVDPASAVHADGSFEFRGIPAGTYVIYGGQAFGNAGIGPPMFVRQEITVAADIEGLSLALVAESELAGTIVVEGGKAVAFPMVWIRESEGRLRLAPANPDSKGAFHFPRRVAPSRWNVELLSLPTGVYVKSMRYGRQDVLHAPLDLTGGAAGSLDIVLSPKVAKVEGSVKDLQGAPAKGVVVSLWTGDMVRTVSSDQNGHFELLDLGPGNYLAAAWEQIAPDLVQAPEFLARFAKDAVTVRLEEGGHSTTDLQIVARARVAAEIAKLQ